MPCRCKGICDSISSPSDKVGYKDPLFSYCSICTKSFLSDKYRCNCCNFQYRKSKHYNPEAPSKRKDLKN